MCQDKNENKPEDEIFLFFLNKACDVRTRPQHYDTLKDRFVRHTLAQALFFNTGRQKLKEKTQPQGGTYLMSKNP